MWSIVMIQLNWLGDFVIYTDRFPMIPLPIISKIVHIIVFFLVAIVAQILYAHVVKHIIIHIHTRTIVTNAIIIPVSLYPVIVCIFHHDAHLMQYPFQTH